ncbi:MAG: magnesium transporter [Desulfomicrobium sp.]|nr:magnesium transporter [Desulfomicrobium sp.]NLV96343.1 magnesium transporter [Desulfovibrionales bacterium]
MANPLFAPELLELLNAGDAQALQEVANALHSAEMAEFIAALDDIDIWRLLSLLPKQHSAEIFSHFDLDRQVELASDVNRQAMARMLEELPHDDRADLVNRLDPQVAEQILPLVARAEREDIRNLASYPEGTVGSIMSSDYATLRPGMTIKEALEQVRIQAPTRETVYYIYVVDAEHHLIGFVSLKDLILAKPMQTVGEMMNTEVIHAFADDNQDTAAQPIEKFDLLALPIVNTENKLVGIVTVDDVMDVQEAEATTDFHKMGGTDLVDVSLKDAGLAVLYRARIPWLMVLVFMNIFSGAGIAHFENTIAAMSSLIFFLPLLIDSGGNAGSQAATLMVRALAIGDVRLRDWFSLLRKEFLISLLLGLTMAMGAMLLAGFRSPEIIVPIGLTMVAIVLFGSLVGMSLPFLLATFRCDPATASAPLITSIADIGGVLIYFSISTWWLRDLVNTAG